jgi:hypothetical protein
MNGILIAINVGRVAERLDVRILLLKIFARFMILAPLCVIQEGCSIWYTVRI